MKRFVIACTTMLALITTAEARQHHHSAGASSGAHHHHSARSGHARSGLYVCGGCVVRDTNAGKVAVSAANADRIVATINDLWNHGFRGPVNCAARPGTHVRGSLHYSGNACDMAQTGWGRTPAKIMYHAGSIIASHGMRDGCSFRDCGHIDMGYALATRRHHHVRYAYHHHRKHYASGV